MRTRRTFLIFISIVIASVFCALRTSADVRKIYLAPHFHYDPVFVEDQNDYTDVGFDRCRRYTAAVEQDPCYAAVFSEIDYLKPFFDSFPEYRMELLKFISENRIETGGSYNEPNEMSVGGEGLIRNILYGRAYDEGVLGDRRDLVYMPFDVFGHTMQLPQILLKSRYIGDVWRKGNPPIEPGGGITVPGLPPDFWGLAPDGSMLLNRREHYKSISGTASEQDLDRKVMEKKRKQDALGLDADFGLLSSADFAYPEGWLTGKSCSLREHQPPIFLSGPIAYFDDISKQISEGRLRLPVITRDFSLYHVGTGLTRVDFKIGNRLAENMLLSAEKFGVVASLLGAEYPEPALDKAWRQLLFNQHHDGITGTCNDRSYFDLLAGYRESLDLGADALYGAAGFIASKIDTSGVSKSGSAIVVFNPSGWKRTDVVVSPVFMQNDLADGPQPILTDSKGNGLAFGIKRLFEEEKGVHSYRIVFIASDVPAGGYKTYFYSNSNSKNTDENKEVKSDALKAFKNTIENEYYSITVDPSRGGTIVKLIDKQTGRIVIDPPTKYPGNELIVIKEDAGSAWELSTAGVKALSSDYPATVQSWKSGDESKIVVEGVIPGVGGYKQEITLYPSIKRIDFLTTLINPVGASGEADRNLWVVRFPARLNGTSPVIEDRFFAAARRRSLNPLEYRTSLEKTDTLSAPYSALNWVEEGTAVRVDIVSSGVVNDSVPIQLCEIVHSHSGESMDAARTLMQALIQRGIPCTPRYDDEDPDADLLNRNFRFVIDIGNDNSFARNIIAKSPGKDGYAQRLQRDGKARLLTAAETSDPEIKSVVTLVLGAKDTNIMAGLIKNISKSIKDDTLIRLSDYEDAINNSNKIAPDNYGIALINRGNILNSFDNNGTIVMGLFHNAPWPQVRMDVPFSFPDEKNHRYEYSLYPHEGDWKDADTWRVGQEVNAPLIAVTTDYHSGSLPPSMSFFDIESESAALSAIKSAGNPYASMKTSVVPGSVNGVVMRFYEAEGKEDIVKIRFFMSVREVWHANLIEEKDESRGRIPVENGNYVSFRIGPNSIETIIVYFKKGALLHEASPFVAPESEPSNVLYSNYWDYNLGAAYMYNSPVSVSLGFPLEKDLPDPGLIKINVAKEKEKKFKKGRNKLRLIVSNNSSDTPLSGILTVRTPGTWKAEPSEIDVELAPKEGKTIDLEVDADKPVPAGFVLAELNTGGMTYFGALRAGQKVELAATAEVKADSEVKDVLEVRIKNNQGSVIYGAAEPIGTIETWPYRSVGELSLVDTGQRIQNFNLEPDNETVLKFNIAKSGALTENHFWFMVKITFNGEFKYIPVVVNEEQ
jgi:alpha-mannosidase